MQLSYYVVHVSETQVILSLNQRYHLLPMNAKVPVKKYPTNIVTWDYF